MSKTLEEMLKEIEAKKQLFIIKMDKKIKLLGETMNEKNNE